MPYPNGILTMPPRVKIEDVKIDADSIRGYADELRQKGFDIPKYFLSPEHIARKEDLFTRDPVLEDINQNQMGDCWFLSALAAILAMGGPMTFQLMMIGIADSVYVQVWDRARLPRFLHVHRSTISTSAKATFHSTGGLWPAMLEKAMTAFQKKAKDDDDNAGLVLDPEHASYQNLSGGFSSNAFRALLGVETDSFPINDLLHTDTDSAEFRMFKQILKGENIDAQVVRTVFPEFAQRWNVNADLFGQALERAAEQTGWYQEWLSVWGGLRGRGGVYRWNDFEMMMDRMKYQFGAHWSYMWVTAFEVVDALKKWVREKRILAEKRNTGMYTQGQLHLWEQIKLRLTSRHPCCLGTQEAVGTAEDTVGSSGEPKSKGIAGKHAYAVIGLFTDAPTGRRYVKLYNPWGRTGRSYTTAPPEIQLQRAQHGKAGKTTFETDSAVFWLELSDVTKRGKKLYYCTETPVLIKAGCKMQAVNVDIR